MASDQEYQTLTAAEKDRVLTEFKRILDDQEAKQPKKLRVKKSA